jgi:hypothetical protein
VAIGIGGIISISQRGENNIWHQRRKRNRQRRRKWRKRQ